MTEPYAGSGAPAALPVCPRHPDRVAYVRCQRCGNPTCPECQRPAAVGIQCVSCVAQSAREHPTTRTVLGGRQGGQTPVVTLTLLVSCVLIWLLQQSSMGTEIFQRFALAPGIGWHEPWRFLTSAFLHGPLIHIGFNMLALWMLGPYLEGLLGRARFLALYLISALGGSVAFVLVNPVNSMGAVVGASGAIFGLFAALIVLNRALGRSTGGIAVTLALNAALPILYPDTIAWQAHIGGFVTGLVLAALFAKVRGNAAAAYAGSAAVTAGLAALGAARYFLG
ncbi:MAG: rhomboid family intramembrane serine protease [Actinobacteria bacterium]|nr:rhomboid family intramembrane serine protease [Actinomycetota bacterium]